MLLAVEGGGFFSSSASGYSKGLTLLLLGQKNEEKPMRVSPWNHYRLVDQESDPELQLASGRSRPLRGCATFVCFGRTSAGLEAPGPLKVGPAQKHDVLQTDSDKGKDPAAGLGYGSTERNSLRSSLKKSSNSISVLNDDGGNVSKAVVEKEDAMPDYSERRRLQWTDACGRELVQIREFEPSEVDGSDDEFEDGNERSCSCVVM